MHRLVGKVRTAAKRFKTEKDQNTAGIYMTARSQKLEHVTT